MYCSKLFLFLYIFTLLKSESVYSNGLHTSNGGPPHYTIFGFSGREGALEQHWAIHLNEDGSSSCVRSRRRIIFWEEITKLSES